MNLRSLLILAASATLCAAGGCTTTVLRVVKPDGTRIEFERYSTGPRNEVGELSAQTPGFSGGMKGYVSDPAAGLQTFDKFLDKLPSR